MADTARALVHIEASLGMSVPLRQ